MITLNLLADRSSSFKKLRRAVNNRAILQQPDETAKLRHAWYRNRRVMEMVSKLIEEAAE
jgi:hypothetical protein